MPYVEFRSMFNQVSWDKPLQWHLNLRSEELSLLERGITIAFFSGLTALCAQIAFVVPWTPVPYTFQTFAVLATGMYLRRNDAFASGCLYLLVGALGAPVFADGGSELVIEGALIASGGYLLAFPFASAIVAEGLDRSSKSETANFNSLLICWTFAMIPVYISDMLDFRNDSSIHSWNSLVSRSVWRRISSSIRVGCRTILNLGLC